MKKIIFIIFLLLIIAPIALAQYQVEIDLPRGEAKPTTLSGYINSIYLTLLALVGIAALGALVYGGFQYMLSGTVGSKEEAKKWIWGALAGLVLGLAAYLILNTINPDLVNIREPDLKPIEEEDLIGPNP